MDHNNKSPVNKYVSKMIKHKIYRISYLKYHFVLCIPPWKQLKTGKCQCNDMLSKYFINICIEMSSLFQLRKELNVQYRFVLISFRSGSVSSHLNLTSFVFSGHPSLEILFFSRYASWRFWAKELFLLTFCLRPQSLSFISSMRIFFFCCLFWLSGRIMFSSSSPLSPFPQTVPNWLLSQTL